jgi:carboxylesterase type B
MQLLREGLVNPARAILGAQTNDSFLFLARGFTKGGLPQPNNHKDGNLRKLSAKEYTKSVAQQVPARFLETVLQIYPAALGGASVDNVHSLARIESDQMHCSLRMRARLLSKVTEAYVYRFNYWYQSNQQCSAVPNFHLPYFGAVHQDEVTFVMGQPNFMEDGSCCGKWGLSEGEEGCDQLQECTACFNRSFGEGYRAYFNEKEFDFSRLIGRFWTNFAASGNPNTRDSLQVTEESWPAIEHGGIVLDADLKSSHAVERELYENAAVCKLWGSVK